MSDDTPARSLNRRISDDTKSKMLEVLSKKQRIHSSNKSTGTSTGSRVGAGKTARIAPKMHRRKVGDA
jgi:hypothetical protein